MRSYQPRLGGLGQVPKLPDGAPCFAHEMCESEGCCFDVAKYGLIPYCSDGLTCMEHDMQLECERLPGGRWLGWQDDIERWVCEVPGEAPPPPEAPAPAPLPSPKPAAPPAPAAPAEVTAPTETSGAMVWMQENPWLVAVGAGLGALAVVALVR
jgi:hypothetical protein